MEFSKLIYLPILKILVIVILGIISGFVFKPSFSIIVICAGVGILFSIYLKSRSLLYFALLFSSGLLLINNLDSILHLQTTENFTSFKALAYGKVADVLYSEKDRAALRIDGKISYYGRKAENFTCLVKIFSRDSSLTRFNVGDELLFSGHFRLPRVSKLPTDPDEVTYALANDFLLYGKTYSSNIIYIWRKPNPIVRFQNRIQNFLLRKVFYLFPNENFALFSALLLANRQFLPEELYRNFSLSGAAHILALSGFHIGIIATVIFFLFSMLRNQWIKFILVSISLLFFLFVIGSPPSAVRATIMVLAFLFVFTLNRRSNILNILALILLISLVFFPNMMFSPGFQMSFLSVLSITLFYKRFSGLFNRIVPKQAILIKYFFSILTTTIAVQILLAPVMAYYFGFFTFISFLANLFIIPLFSLAIIYGFIALLISIILPWLAIYFAFSADSCLELAKFIISQLVNNLSDLVIRNDFPVLTGVLVSLFLILISYSKGVFDLTVKFIILLFSFFAFNFFLVRDERKLCYFPREKFVFVSIEFPEKNICFILDKKPRQRPQIDLYVVKYLEEKMNNLYVGYTGNIGIASADYLKHKYKFQTFAVPIDLQIRLSKSLFGDLSIFSQYQGKIWRFE